MSSHTKAILAIFLVSVSWGTAGAVAKILTSELHPFVILFYRFGIASLCVLPFFLQEKKPKRAWKELVPLSILSAGNAIFFYLGVSQTTANSAMVIGTATPLVTLLLSHILIHEHISKAKFVGVITGLAGALYIIFLPIIRTQQSLGGNLLGNLFVGCALLSWALYSIGARHVVVTARYSAFTTVSFNFFTVTFITLFLALITKQPFITPDVINIRYGMTLLYAAIPMTLMTFSLFQWALKHLPVSTVALKDYFQLICGLGFNALLLGEKLSLDFVIGSVIVLAGVFIATSWRLIRKIHYFANAA